jgi:alanine racemase
MSMSRGAMEHLSQDMRPTWKEIDLGALASNYLQVKKLIGPHRKIIASVKANAYGHGIVPVARALESLGVYSLATGSPLDVVAMRDAGIRKPILMFGCTLPSGVTDLLRLGVMPTIHNMDLARAISQAAKSTVRVFIKVDCGLGRLGVPAKEATAFVNAVVALPHLQVEGIYTHLPFTNETGLVWAREGVRSFDALLSELNATRVRIPVSQALASAGIWAGIPDSCSAVCVGHLLYGLHSGTVPHLNDFTMLRPVLRAIKSRLIHVGFRRAGQRAGMDGAFVTPTNMTIGVLPIGLFDGYRKASSGKHAIMLLRGCRVEVLGVSLEHTVVDLSGVEHPEIGEEVMVLGESTGASITAETLGEWQGKSPLEVLVGFDSTLPLRIVSNGPSGGMPGSSADQTNHTINKRKTPRSRTSSARVAPH